jgi:hypothetical protein
MTCVDNAKAFETALLDRLGKNDIVWESDGFTSKSKLWLTYEEVINANTRSEPLPTEERFRTTVGAAL